MRDRLHMTDTVEAGARRDPLSRHFVCPVCGGRVDRRDLEQVYYHNDEPHPPRSDDASRYD